MRRRGTEGAEGRRRVSRIHTYRHLANASPLSCAALLDEVIERAVCMVKRARNYTDDVGCSCEDAGRTPVDDLARVGGSRYKPAREPLIFPIP